MSERKVSEVLDLAADEIQRRGWFSYGMDAKGAVRDPDSHCPWGGGAGSEAPVCLEGGIAAAAGIAIPSHAVSVWDSNYERDKAIDRIEECPAYLAVQRYLIETGRLWEDGHLYAFNDSPHRSKDEVIAVLRAAAAVERAKEESLENSEVAA